MQCLTLLYTVSTSLVQVTVDYTWERDLDVGNEMQSFELSGDGWAAVSATGGGTGKIWEFGSWGRSGEFSSSNIQEALPNEDLSVIAYRSNDIWYLLKITPGDRNYSGGSPIQNNNCTMVSPTKEVTYACCSNGLSSYFNENGSSAMGPLPPACSLLDTSANGDVVVTSSFIDQLQVHRINENLSINETEQRTIPQQSPVTMHTSANATAVVISYAGQTNSDIVKLNNSNTVWQLGWTGATKVVKGEPKPYGIPSWALSFHHNGSHAVATMFNDSNGAREGVWSTATGGDDVLSVSTDGGRLAVRKNSSFVSVFKGCVTEMLPKHYNINGNGYKQIEVATQYKCHAECCADEVCTVYQWVENAPVGTSYPHKQCLLFSDSLDALVVDEKQPFHTFAVRQLLHPNSSSDEEGPDYVTVVTALGGSFLFLGLGGYFSERAKQARIARDREKVEAELNLNREIQKNTHIV
eukprot:TRINITY_DN4967_c0_g3_i1.p1 TRINITY_DN4967_c0_g3~~TRINITY_DN4967_c0_g3_i1.p1  ORF type:complete len:467 (+),score=82.11 TRINITY_DN4967_c0_g3_i1:47-1447(+)